MNRSQVRPILLCAAVAAFLAGTAGAAEAPLPPAPPTPPGPPPPVERVRVLSGGSFLGVNVAELDNERARALGLPEERGVEVTLIEPEGPAAKGGLKAGDVVLEYNGQRVEGTEQFVRLVRETPPGRQVKRLVHRGGSAQTITLTTGTRKSRGYVTGFTAPRIEIPELLHLPDVPKALLSWRSASLGIEAESLESQLADYFGVKEGVLVRSVMRGSAAGKAGLKAGDVIVKVDNTPVATPREITSAIRSLRSRSATLAVVRNRQEISINVSLEDDGRSDGRPGWRAVRSVRVAAGY